MGKAIAAAEVEVGFTDGIGSFVGSADDSHGKGGDSDTKGGAGIAQHDAQDARVVMDMAMVSTVSRPMTAGCCRREVTDV